MGDLLNILGILVSVVMTVTYPTIIFSYFKLKGEVQNANKEIDILTNKVQYNSDFCKTCKYMNYYKRNNIEID